MRLRKFRDFVIWREGALIDNIGDGRESLSDSAIYFKRSQSEFAMAIEDTAPDTREGFRNQRPIPSC